MEYTGKHQSKVLIDDYLGSGKELVKAISEYGRDNFEKEILFVFKTEEEMNAKEKEIVTEEYCASNLTYNLCPGGYGGFGYINNIYWKENPLTSNHINFRDTHGTLGSDAFSQKMQSDNEFNETFKQIQKKSALKRWANVSKEDRRGVPHTQLTKNKMSAINSILLRGDKNPNYGKIWITDGFINKMIKKNLPLPEGFRKGRVV